MPGPYQKEASAPAPGHARPGTPSHVRTDLRAAPIPAAPLSSPAARAAAAPNRTALAAACCIAIAHAAGCLFWQWHACVLPPCASAAALPAAAQTADKCSRPSINTLLVLCQTYMMLRHSPESVRQAHCSEHCRHDYGLRAGCAVDTVGIEQRADMPVAAARSFYPGACSACARARPAARARRPCHGAAAALCAAPCALPASAARAAARLPTPWHAKAPHLISGVADKSRKSGHMSRAGMHAEQRPLCWCGAPRVRQKHLR